MKIEIFQKIIRYYFRLNAKNIFFEFTTNYKFMFTYSSINIYYRFYFLILYNLTFNWIFFEHWILFECKDKKALNFIWMEWEKNIEFYLNAKKWKWVQNWDIVMVYNLPEKINISESLCYAFAYIKCCICLFMLLTLYLFMLLCFENKSNFIWDSTNHKD